MFNPQNYLRHLQSRSALGASVTAVILCAPSLAQTIPAQQLPWKATGSGTAVEGLYTAEVGTTKPFIVKEYLLDAGTIQHKSFLLQATVELPKDSGLSVLFAGPDATPLDPINVNRNAPNSGLRSGRVIYPAVDSTTPLQLRIYVNNGTMEFSLGSITERRTGIPSPLGVSLKLTQGAKISNLTFLPINAGDTRPVLGIENAAKVPLAEVAGGLAPASVASGFIQADGTVFYLPAGKAADISASMAGAKDPIRKTRDFYGAASLSTMGRTLLKVRGDQYSALHVLAYSAGRPNHAPRMTVRVGYYGKANAILEDTVLNVPVLTSNVSGPQVLGKIPVKLANGKEGFLYHLRVPMPQTGNVKEFEDMDLEFTRDMNTNVMLPDPNEFGRAPAGLPSDVVLLAATMEPSPVTMTYTTAEAGNVFNDKQRAVFALKLSNRSDKPRSVRAFAKAEGPGTVEDRGVQRRNWTVEKTIQIAPGQSVDVPFDVTPGKRGWFSCQLGVEVDGTLVQKRDTTFAVLAPDTRKALAESPFGIWEFWYAHSVKAQPDQVARLASLINKGGWRWTYGGAPKGLNVNEPNPDIYKILRDKYKLTFTIQNLPNSYQRDAGWWDEKEFNETVLPAIQEGLQKSDGYFKVLHESRSSPDLIRRYSPYLGGIPYAMPPAEAAKIDEQFERVKQYTAAVKKADPKAKIVLFNDYPAVPNEFMKRGFPAENFDVIGLEGAMFLRSPERQPDWLTLLGNMQEIKRSMAKNGYNKPIWTTEALYHPTEDGALSLHEQAVISVREAMMALQLGVQRMAAAGVIKDPSDDYHWSNWGSAGLCYRDPEINPKPVYAAYAWMTQILDQAKPNGHIKTPNYALHVVDFRKPDGSHVYSVWTANGIQKVTLTTKNNARPQVFDLYGNPLTVAGPLTLEASQTPIYLTGAEIEAVQDAIPVEVPDTNTGELLLDFDKPGQLKPIDRTDSVLGTSWDTPRIKGNLDTSLVTEDGASAIRVELKPDTDPRTLLPRYAEYELAKPIELKGRPEEFVFRVKGNSGWGRVIFELTDAKGRVWTSTGNQYAGSSNASDPHGESFVNFEGWQTMRFPIVGMYPGTDQTMMWPRNYNWWAFPAPETAAIPELQAAADATYETAKVKYAEAKTTYDALMIPYQEKLKAYEEANKDVPVANRPKKPNPPTAPILPKRRNVAYMGTVPVDYPLTLRKISFTLRPHILYLDEEIPVKNQVFYLDKLSVTQAPAP